MIMSKIAEMLEKVRSAPTKEYQRVMKEIMEEVFKEEFRNVLEKETFGSIVELIIEFPEDTFEEFVAKYKDLLNKKIQEATPSDIGRLYEGITKNKRKIISINFRPTIVKRLASFGLDEIVRMLYNVVPATRETVLNQYKEIMMRPDFTKKMLEASIDTLAEFLSLAPSSVRDSLIRRHQDFFTSNEFVEKLKSVGPDERAMILRWLPENLTRQIVSKLP